MLKLEEIAKDAQITGLVPDEVVKVALLRKRRLRVVLHLETPQHRSRLRPSAIEADKVLQKLKQLIKAVDPHPFVVDQHSIKPGMSWVVQG